MGRFGGYYKGEKKKGKKDRTAKGVSFGTLTFIHPEIISRKRKNE